MEVARKLNDVPATNAQIFLFAEDEIVVDAAVGKCLESNGLGRGSVACDASRGWSVPPALHSHRRGRRLQGRFRPCGSYIVTMFLTGMARFVSRFIFRATSGQSSVGSTRHRGVDIDQVDIHMLLRDDQSRRSGEVCNVSVGARRRWWQGREQRCRR